MAFFAPLIVSAIGVTGATAAVAQVAIGVGLSFAAKKLTAKKARPTASDDRGVRVGLQIDTNPDRVVVIGETLVPGSLVYWQLSGTNNDRLHMVIALADHECTSLQGVYVNGKLKSWNSGSGQVSGYSGKLAVRFYSGAAGQTADAAVIAASEGRWTANDVGAGVCYVVVEMDYDEEVFPEGIPDLGFVIRGAKLYDPRTGTTAYSDNPVVAIWNLLRGITVQGEKLAGMNVPAAAIRLSEAQAAANACDEDVALKAGGTEKRYRCGLWFGSGTTNREILENLIAAMAGEVIETGGIYRILAGVAQSPVAALTDADLIPSEPLITRPRRPRSEIVNSVGGSYTDPARGYTENPLPLRNSSIDEALDGGIRLTRMIDLSAVTSRAQAQRVLEIERKRARRMGSASMRLRARWFVLEAGDWVTFTSDRRGYASKTFEISSTSSLQDLQSDVVLAETDDQIDDWVASTDEISDNQVIDLKSAGPSLNSVSGVILLSVTLAANGAIKRPALQMQWTPITDQTVTDLEIEYRKVGDTVAIKTPRVLEPSSGSYTWATGVQSGVQYEARVRPICRPARGVNWSSWVQSSTPTGDHVVPVAGLATSLPPGIVTPAELSAQARFELSLMTEVDDVLGSVSQQIKALSDASDQAHLATIQSILAGEDNKTQIRAERIERVTQDLVLAQQIETISAQINTSIVAAIQEERTARVTADGSLAQQIATVVTRMDGNEVAVTALSQAIDGLTGRWGVAINANGQVVGLVQLDGSAQAGSTFTVVANNFKIAQPGVAGGAAVPIFAIQNVNGVAKLALRGDMFADGAIAARSLAVATLSALSANLGTVTAGVIRDAQNRYVFNVAEGRLYTVNGSFLLDMVNGRLTMG